MPRGEHLKGRRLPNSGRKPGQQNHMTRTVKAAFEEAFNALQTDPAAKLENWAKEHPTEFYKLSAKLIPLQVIGDKANPLVIRMVGNIPPKDVDA